MSKLHELLAVEGDLKGEKDKVRQEALIDFEKKPNLFLGYSKKLSLFDANRANEETEEVGQINTNVIERLKYNAQSHIRYWDAKLQKEIANQEAKANIEIDGKILMENVPVSFLLTMEEELKQLRKVYDQIPTLRPGIDWQLDETLGKNIYKTVHPTEKIKTEKALEFTIMVPATKEHPAQVKEWTIDKPVGKYIETVWSGMISSADKSLFLSKLDKILRAIKKARQRANCQEVKKANIGKLIFDFIQS